KELKDLPPEVLPLLKAEHVTGSLDLGTTAKIDLVAGYKTANDAQEAEKAIKSLAELARKELGKIKSDMERKLFEAKAPRTLNAMREAVFSVFAIGALNQIDEMLANPGALIKRNGSELTASITLPKEVVAGAAGLAAIYAGLLIPAIQKVRAAPGRIESQ